MLWEPRQGTGSCPTGPVSPKATPDTAGPGGAAVSGRGQGSAVEGDCAPPGLWPRTKPHSPEWPATGTRQTAQRIGASPQNPASFPTGPVPKKEAVNTTGPRGRGPLRMPAFRRGRPLSGRREAPRPAGLCPGRTALSQDNGRNPGLPRRGLQDAHTLPKELFRHKKSQGRRRTRDSRQGLPHIPSSLCPQRRHRTTEMRLFPSVCERGAGGVWGTRL